MGFQPTPLGTRSEKLPASQAQASNPGPQYPRHICHILINFLQGLEQSLPGRSKPPVCRAPLAVGTTPVAFSWTPYPEALEPQPLHHPLPFPGPLAALLTQHHSGLSPASGHTGLKQTFSRLPTLIRQPRKGFWGCPLDPTDADITHPSSGLQMPPPCPSWAIGIRPAHLGFHTCHGPERCPPHSGKMPRWVQGTQGTRGSEAGQRGTTHIIVPRCHFFSPRKVPDPRARKERKQPSRTLKDRMSHVAW